MTDYSLLLTAFGMGLLGSTHCLGMCGGIAGALSLQTAHAPSTKQSQNTLYALCYSLGRICSYGIAGILLGSLGLLIADGMGEMGALSLRLFAGLLLISLGLYLGGWWQGISVIEKLGGTVWKKLSPTTKRLLPINSPIKAIVVGSIWGWLPCGLVYSALIWASTAANPLHSGILMIFFGLGTLPALLLSGIFAQQLMGWIRKTWIRSASGILLVAFGLWTIYGAIQHNQSGHHEHAGHQMHSPHQ